MELLILSNGHGEDAIACALIPHLRDLGVAPTALPIVGEGGAYQRLGVPILGPARLMPSGGFVYGRPAALWGDLRGGLVGLTRAQIAAIKAARDRFDRVLAVGDIVVLLFAWLTGKPFAFVGCAKSDHYLGGKPGAYLWHERLLMRHPRCRGVYPRDAVTTENLRALGIHADYLGNPMMDGLTPGGAPLPEADADLTVLLLPGSRQEAYANLAVLRRQLPALAAALGDRAPRFLAAIAPGLPLAGFAGDGWTLSDDTLQHPGGTRLHLIAGRFADAAHAADLGLAMAGTATEQLVGLGKPVIAIPGRGPQFTPAFAEAQSRLLGESLLVLPDDPERVASAARTLLADPARLERLRSNGQARMGLPGASRRIAEAVSTLA